MTHPTPPPAPCPRHGPQQLWHIWQQRTTAVSHLQKTPKLLSAGQRKDQLPQGCLNNTSPSWRALALIKAWWCLREERCCRITMQSDPHSRAAKPWDCTVLTEPELRVSDLGTGGCHSSFQVVSGTPLFADHSTPSHYIMQVFSKKINPTSPKV